MIRTIGIFWVSALAAVSCAQPDGAATLERNKDHLQIWRLPAVRQMPPGH
jgi:hypothetical protein